MVVVSQDTRRSCINSVTLTSTRPSAKMADNTDQFVSLVYEKRQDKKNFEHKNKQKISPDIIHMFVQYSIYVHVLSLGEFSG